jgi:hypothetical protein
MIVSSGKLITESINHLRKLISAISVYSQRLLKLTEQFVMGVRQKIKTMDVKFVQSVE